MIADKTAINKKRVAKRWQSISRYNVLSSSDDDFFLVFLATWWTTQFHNGHHPRNAGTSNGVIDQFLLVSLEIIVKIRKIATSFLFTANCRETGEATLTRLQRQKIRFFAGELSGPLPGAYAVILAFCPTRPIAVHLAPESPPCPSIVICLAPVALGKR